MSRVRPRGPVAKKKPEKSSKRPRAWNSTLPVGKKSLKSGGNLKAKRYPRFKKRHIATPEERKHLRKVKRLPCALTGEKGRSEAHHIRIGTEYKNHWATIPLTPEAHDLLHSRRKQFREFEEGALVATLKDLYREDWKVYCRKAGR